VVVVLEAPEETELRQEVLRAPRPPGLLVATEALEELVAEGERVLAEPEEQEEQLSRLYLSPLVVLIPMSMLSQLLLSYSLREV
jgi:hypothetical protein